MEGLALVADQAALRLDLAEVFLAAVFLAGAFLAAGFLLAAFLAAVFLLVVLLSAALLVLVVLLTAFPEALSFCSPSSLFRLRRSISVRSSILAPPGSASCVSGSLTVSGSPASTFSFTSCRICSLNESVNISGFHLPLMSLTSCSPMAISFSVNPVDFVPSAGRLSSSHERISSSHRNRFSISAGPHGSSTARCCLVWMTTFAIPTLLVFRSTSRNRAYTLAPLLMGDM